MMTPEEYQLLLELGSYGGQDEQLQQQLHSAQAMRNPAQRAAPLSPLAAVFGGIGDSLQTAGSYIQEANINRDRRQLLERRQKGRQIAGDLATAAPDVSPL